MRLLAISDIHDNVEAVRRLRFIETNRFDAIVIAGDIGKSSISEILQILETFCCPVLYVLGNWDYTVDYDTVFTPNATHLHLSPTSIGPITFVGFSGCDASWGKNPIATAARDNLLSRHPDFVPAKLRWAQLRQDRKYKKKEKAFLISRYETDRKGVIKDLSSANRDAMIEVLRTSGCNPLNTVVVTHDRVYKIGDFLPGLRMHLFGHRHGFQETTHNGLKCVNVSALDVRYIVECNTASTSSDAILVFDYGTYTILEMSTDVAFQASSHRLYPDSPAVKRTGILFHGRTEYELGQEGQPFAQPSSASRTGYWSCHPLPVLRFGDPPRHPRRKIQDLT